MEYDGGQGGSSSFSSSPSSYYSILGVSRDSSTEDIKRAYRRLALQWHPDRWTRRHSSTSEAKRNFQQIQEAYSILSDKKKRAFYDVGLYDPQEEEEEDYDEGFSDFVQELWSLMAHESKEKRNYSMEELQAMLREMVQGFESSLSSYGSASLDDPSRSKWPRCDSSTMIDDRVLHRSWPMYGTSGFAAKKCSCLLFANGYSKYLERGQKKRRVFRH